LIALRQGQVNEHKRKTIPSRLICPSVGLDSVITSGVSAFGLRARTRVSAIGYHFSSPREAFLARGARSTGIKKEIRKDLWSGSGILDNRCQEFATPKK
jgi:hypothetical protein